MGKEIQSEKLPIFDSQKSTKSTIKLLKMSQLKAFKVDQTFCNTLYLQKTIIYNEKGFFFKLYFIYYALACLRAETPVTGFSSGLSIVNCFLFLGNCPAPN